MTNLDVCTRKRTGVFSLLSQHVLFGGTEKLCEISIRAAGLWVEKQDQDLPKAKRSVEHMTAVFGIQYFSRKGAH
jgi:hypothetical protein